MPVDTETTLTQSTDVTTEGDPQQDAAINPPVADPEPGDAPTGNEPKETEKPSAAAKPESEKPDDKWSAERRRFDKTIQRQADQIKAYDDRWAKVDELADSVKELRALLKDGLRDPTLTETPELNAVQTAIAGDREKRQTEAQTRQANEAAQSLKERQDSVWPDIERVLREKGYEADPQTHEWQLPTGSQMRVIWGVDPESVIEMAELLPAKEPEDKAKAKRVAGMASSPSRNGTGGGNKARTVAEAASRVKSQTNPDGTWTLADYQEWKEKNPNAPYS